MSNVNLLPPLLTRIGFSEIDIKVYTAVLGLGKTSIGELLVVTGSDPLTLFQSVKNLEELGFVKKVAGRTPQYFAMLPFLKEYLVIEKDAIYSIDGILTSLKKSEAQYKTQRSQFGEKLEVSEDNPFFDIHIISGAIKQLHDTVYLNYVDQSKDLEESVVKIYDECLESTIKNIASLSKHPVSFSTQLETYLQELIAFIKQFKHSAEKHNKDLTANVKDKLTSDLDLLKNKLFSGLSEHLDQHQSYLDKLNPELESVLAQYIMEVGEIQTSFTNKYNQMWEEAYNTWVEESRSLVKETSLDVNNLFSEQIKDTQALRRSIEQIDRKIQTISSLIANSIDKIDSATMLKFGKSKQQVTDPLLEAREEIKNMANDLSENGLQLIDKHVLSLNETRDTIKAKLDHFQITGSTNIRTKKKSATEEAEAKIEKLPDELLEKIKDKAGKYAQGILESSNKMTEKQKKQIQEQINETNTKLLEITEQYSKNSTENIQDIQNKVLSELEKGKKDTQAMGDKIQKSIIDYGKQVDEELKAKKAWIMEFLEEKRRTIGEEKDGSKEKVLKQIKEAEEIQINTLVSQVASVVNEIDADITSQLRSLNEKATVLHQVLITREDELKQIDKAAATYHYEGQYNTSVIVGEEAIVASLTDLAMRAKSSLLLVTPEADEQLYKEMMNFTKSSRITLVSSFDRRKDVMVLRNIQERFSNVILKHYDKKDVFCGIIDGANEGIFAFRVTDEVTIAVRTTNEQLLQLFKNSINRDVLFLANDFEL